MPGAGGGGYLVAETAKAAGVESVVFDRNGYLYHGRVKELADGALSDSRCSLPAKDSSGGSPRR